MKCHNGFKTFVYMPFKQEHIYYEINHQLFFSCFDIKFAENSEY